MVDDLLRAALRSPGCRAAPSRSRARRRCCRRPSSWPRRRPCRCACPGRRAGPAACRRGKASLCVWLGADRAQAAGDHDRLVVAALHAGHASARRRGSSRRRLGRPNSLLKAAPPSGPSIMICSALAMCAGLADGRALPRLVGAGQVQVRDREAGQPGLGPRAAAGRAFVADLAAGAGGGAGEGRDRGRVVVRLDLHQHVRRSRRARRRAARWCSPAAASARPAPPSITEALSL